MPNNVYSEIHLHLTWHTKYGAVIEPAFERTLHRCIHDYAERTQGVQVHAINGTADHVHLAVAIPPTLNASEWLGQLKGASAQHINHRLTNPPDVRLAGRIWCRQFRGEGSAVGRWLHRASEGTPFQRQHS